MRSDITGEKSPINWDTREFNYGIVYRNGIITIDEPGFYRITAAICMHDWSDTRGSQIAINTVVNGVSFLRACSTWGSPGLSYGIKYLDVFDTVYFEKKWGSSTRYNNPSNYFSIEKL